MNDRTHKQTMVYAICFSFAFTVAPPAPAPRSSRSGSAQAAPPLYPQVLQRTGCTWRYRSLRHRRPCYRRRWLRLLSIYYPSLHAAPPLATAP